MKSWLKNGKNRDSRLEELFVNKTRINIKLGAHVQNKKAKANT